MVSWVLLPFFAYFAYFAVKKSSFAPPTSRFMLRELKPRNTPNTRKNTGTIKPGGLPIGKLCDFSKPLWSLGFFCLFSRISHISRLKKSPLPPPAFSSFFAVIIPAFLVRSGLARRRSALFVSLDSGQNLPATPISCRWL